MTASGRRGFVLVAVLLLLVAMTVLTHGLLVLLREQRRAAGVVWTVRQARVAASGLAAREVAALDRLPDTTTLRRESFEGGRATIEVRPLSREVALVEASVDSVGHARAAGFAWVLDPAVRIASLPLAAEVGVWPEGETLARVVPPPIESCESEVLPGASGRPPLAVRPAHDTVTAFAPPGLGRLAGSALVEALIPLPATSGSPQPVVSGGVCVSDAWNWGDPTEPDGPCGDRLASATAPGDLHVGAGVGQGLVLVAGDLVLSGVTFRGVLLVAGDLTLTDGSEMEGVARVGGALHVAPSSRFSARPCAAYDVLSALARSGRLGGALSLGRPGWSVH